MPQLIIEVPDFGRTILWIEILGNVGWRKLGSYGQAPASRLCQATRIRSSDGLDFWNGNERPARTFQRLTRNG